MPLIVRKPTQWPFQRGLTHPRWNWVWGGVPTLWAISWDGKNMIDYSNFAPTVDVYGVVGGNPTVRSDPILGVCPRFDGSADRFDWPGRPTAENNISFFVTYIAEVFDTAETYIHASSSASGRWSVGFLPTSGGFLAFNHSGIASINLFSLAAQKVTGAPYAIAVSHNPVTQRTIAALRRLDTGKTWTTDVADTASFIGGSGTVSLGGFGFGPVTSLTGRISVGGILESAQPMAHLLQWVSDPYGSYEYVSPVIPVPR